MICVENSHNACGGKALPLEWLEKVFKTNFYEPRKKNFKLKLIICPTRVYFLVEETVMVDNYFEEGSWGCENLGDGGSYFRALLHY